MYGWLGQIEAVEQLARQIKDPSHREEKQADLVQALVQTKQFDAAAQRVQEISHWQTKQEALETLAIGLVRAGQGQAAIEQARLLESVYNRPRVLIHIARVLVQCGQEQQASECLVEAARLLDGEEEREFRIDILHKLSAAARLMSDSAVTLSLVQRLWSQATHRDDLYALLPAAMPLFATDPTLLPQILAGEQWVNDQLRS
jgi:hypothetical protein